MQLIVQRAGPLLILRNGQTSTVYILDGKDLAAILISIGTIDSSLAGLGRNQCQILQTLRPKDP